MQGNAEWKVPVVLRGRYREGGTHCVRRDKCLCGKGKGGRL